MYCWSCGRENSDESLFCSNCGKQLLTSGEKTEEQKQKRMNPHLFSMTLWVGILLLLGGTLSIMVVGSSAAMIIVALGMAFIAFALVFFLISLYRCWAILRDFSPRTTPAKAVGFSLIPILNIYWIFKSIYGFAVDANSFAEQGGSKKKISETLSIVTCFILILPVVNFFALILMNFLIYQWANFFNTVSVPVNQSLKYPALMKGKYLQGKFNINKVFACGLAGILLIIIGAEIIRINKHEDASAEAIAWLNKGLNFRKNKEYDKAIAAFTSVINFDQNHAQAYYERGGSYFDQEQFDLA
ncbi:MAG: zinc-ribbon domain-containing protein, partial [Syntrophales bacterium]